jgi:hypothetical protein
MVQLVESLLNLFDCNNKDTVGLVWRLRFDGIRDLHGHRVALHLFS